MEYTRRHVFVVGGALVSASLAGCLGDDDDEPGDDANGDTDGDDANGDDEDEEDEEDVSERIDAAKSHISESNERFETALDGPDPMEGERLNTQPVEESLDAASAELDAARPHATDEELETIESLDSILDFLREFLTVLVEFDTVMAEFGTADEFIETDQWEEAIPPLQRADDAVTTTSVRLDDARAAFDAMDDSQLAEFDEIDRAEMEALLDEFADDLFALDGMITGLVEVARGILPFEDGATAMDNEAWDQAQQSFAEAAEHFGRAEYEFETTAADASGEYRDDLLTFACQWGHFYDTAEHFENAAVALDQGDDETANSEIEAAQDALTLAEQC